MRAFLGLVVVASGGLAACNRSDSQSQVSANAPADCTKVGEIVATFELGAGGAPDARAASVAKHRDACKTHALTAAEATCIAKATSSWEVFPCAPRMFPERAGSSDCKAIAARLRETILADLPKDIGSAGVAMVDRMVPIIEQSCAQDSWPADFRACVLGAPPADLEALNKCDPLLPQEQQVKMGERLKPVVQATLNAPAPGSAGSAAPTP